MAKIKEEVIIFEKTAPEYKKENRKLRFQEDLKINVMDVQPEKLKDLALFLNSKRGEHIDEVYLTESGEFCYNKYEFNGKFYNRYITEKFEDASGNVGKKIKFDDNCFEIIKTYTADEIIDIYYDWVNNQAKKKK